MEIHNFAFAPASDEARVGDTIAFVNRDFAPHTATETASRWGTEQIDYGKSAFVVATTAGRFVYHCHFHPEMTGVLIVASR